MRYLGRMSGNGVLKCAGQDIARAAFDIEGYLKKPAGVTGSGEIRLACTVLKDVFGRKDVQLLTDDGRLLDLRFSDKKLTATSEIAHVDVTGELPSNPQIWGH